MTIIRATDDTAINVGQWVHGASGSHSPSGLQYGLHSEPRQVTRFAGKRVHYRRIDGSESFMLRDAVLIVCDTEDEAKAVHWLSLMRNHDMSERIRNVTEECSGAYEERLATLITEWERV